MQGLHDVSEAMSDGGHPNQKQQGDDPSGALHRLRRVHQGLRKPCQGGRDRSAGFHQALQIPDCAARADAVRAVPGRASAGADHRVAVPAGLCRCVRGRARRGDRLLCDQPRDARGGPAQARDLLRLPGHRAADSGQFPGTAGQRDRLRFAHGGGSQDRQGGVCAQARRGYRRCGRVLHHALRGEDDGGPLACGPHQVLRRRRDRDQGRVHADARVPQGGLYAAGDRPRERGGHQVGGARR